ncbi:hypothetical protein BDZ94DRAFT_1275126 [Collybia nuda]|uniref:Uncharacterized protein n=1 Tax=Collybia nuda TaxID=64659 RepID=A0A9P5XTQ3_9AGAR|nr:hypothetical protein BDZ94DRAFT_1275126 [Collybia nuda]
MATYLLNIVIDDAELKALKSSGYSLCVAKNVNGQFNVVWKGIQFLAFNTIEWTEQYQVFGEIGFTSGHPVKSGTNASSIQYGQTCTLSDLGIMGPAQGPRGGSSFKVQNDFGSINLAVNGMIDGKWLPVYVDPTPTITGAATFKPIVSILVWFDRTLQTSTMFTEAVSTSIEVDYTGTTSQTLSYVSGGSGPGSGIWVMGDSTTGLRFTPGKIYHPLSKKFEDLPFANDKQFIQTLVDKYFTTPLGKKNQDTITDYIVQALITFGANVVLAQVAKFINDHLPRSVRVSIKYEASALVVKIGWAQGVLSKDLVMGGNDVEKLEGLFNNMINTFKPGYRSLDYTVLNGSVSNPAPGSGSCASIPMSDTISYDQNLQKIVSHTNRITVA